MNMQELPQPPARDEPRWQAARLPPDREAGRERKMKWTSEGGGEMFEPGAGGDVSGFQMAQPHRHSGVAAHDTLEKSERETKT